MRVMEGRYGEFEFVRDLKRLSFHILSRKRIAHPRETVQVRGFIAVDLDLDGISDA